MKLANGTDNVDNTSHHGNSGKDGSNKLMELYFS